MNKNKLRISTTRPFFVAASQVLYQRVQWEKAHAMAPLSCVCVCLRHNFIIALSTAGVDNVICYCCVIEGAGGFLDYLLSRNQGALSSSGLLCQAGGKSCNMLCVL